MKTVKLLEFSLEDKVSKNGKSYKLARAKFEGDDQIRTGFGNYTMNSWEPGMTVQVELFEEEWNGNMYPKFKAPSATDVLAAQVKDLEARVAKLEGGTTAEKGPDDLPF